MADIFRIKSMDAALELDGVEYKIHDPNFLAKNDLFKKSTELDKKKAEMSLADTIQATKLINLEMIQVYLPDVPMETLQKMGTGALTSLMQHLLKLSEDNFGAVVEKVEKK